MTPTRRIYSRRYGWHVWGSFILQGWLKLCQWHRKTCLRHFVSSRESCLLTPVWSLIFEGIVLSTCETHDEAKLWLQVFEDFHTGLRETKFRIQRVEPAGNATRIVLQLGCDRALTPWCDMGQSPLVQPEEG